MTENQNIESLNFSKTILLFGDDQKASMNIGNKLVDEFRDYELLVIDNLNELDTRIKKINPTAVIIQHSRNQVDDLLTWFKTFRLSPKLSKIPCVYMSTRAEMEKIQEKTIALDFYFVPLPLRVPFLVETLHHAIKRVNSIKVEVLNYKAGDIIFSEGEQSSHLYIVKEGALRAQREGVILGEIQAGEVLGELAFLLEKERGASVVAESDAILYRLKLEDFQTYIEKQPFWIDLIIKSLAQRLDKTNEKIQSNL